MRARHNEESPKRVGERQAQPTIFRRCWETIRPFSTGLMTTNSRMLITALVAVTACGGEKKAGTDTTRAANTGGASAAACTGDNGGLTLAPGFCATVFADSIGHARHIVVAP